MGEQLKDGYWTREKLKKLEIEVFEKDYALTDVDRQYLNTHSFKECIEYLKKRESNNNLELSKLQNKYNEIYGIKTPINDQEISKYIKDIIDFYPYGWEKTPIKLKIEFLKKAVQEKKKIIDVTNYFTEGVYFDAPNDEKNQNEG